MMKLSLFASVNATNTNENVSTTAAVIVLMKFCSVTETESGVAKPRLTTRLAVKLGVTSTSSNANGHDEVMLN